MSMQYGASLRGFIERTLEEWLLRRARNVKTGVSYNALILDTYGLPSQGFGEPVLFSFATNGTQGFIADYGATYTAVEGGDGGGDFAYTINGSTASSPFTLLVGDEFRVTLSGATIGTDEVRLLKLARTA